MVLSNFLFNNNFFAVIWLQIYLSNPYNSNSDDFCRLNNAPFFCGGEGGLTLYRGCIWHILSPANWAKDDDDNSSTFQKF